MNKAYLFVPAALLAAFAFYHHETEAERTVLEQQRETRLAAAKRIDDARKAEAKLKATEEANQRAADREAQLRVAAEKKRRDHEAVVQKIETDVAKYAGECAQLEGEVATLAQRVAEARENRADIEREAFALARTVEEQRVARRNAELEIQRATRMFIARLDASAMVNPTVTGRRGSP